MVAKRQRLLSTHYRQFGGHALCYGWIGVGKSLDESRYVIRFTPRKPTSTWSASSRARRIKQFQKP